MSPITASPASGRNSIKAISDLGVRAYSIHETGNLKYDYFFGRSGPRRASVGGNLAELRQDQQRHCGTETFAKLQALKTEFCDTVTIDKF